MRRPGILSFTLSQEKHDEHVFSHRRQIRPPLTRDMRSASPHIYHTSRHADQRPRHDLTQPPHIPHHSPRLPQEKFANASASNRNQKKSKEKKPIPAYPGADVEYQSPLFFGASIRERKAFFVINICFAFDCKEEKAAKCDSSQSR